MSVRPPKSFSASIEDPISAALEREILTEKADTLARLNKKLEAALERIPDVEAQVRQTEREQHHQLVAEAGEALWHVTIQRELCGLTRHNSFFDHMRVPLAVRLRAGPLLRKEA